MKENLYYAEIARFDKNGNGEGRSWGFYVSPEKYSVFTIKVAKEILEGATEEFKTRFNEDIDFNFVSLKMGDTKGKYWKDKNKLLIYKNESPVYENNNGIICRDPVAIADSTYGG